MPNDLKSFYQAFGGAELFLGQNFGFRIVDPTEFKPSNAVILGADFCEKHASELSSDVTRNWYVVARGTGPEETVTIDLSAERRGYCYDSFWEIHGTSDSPVVALSFTELLERLLLSGGKELYWDSPEFPDYGPARE